MAWGEGGWGAGPWGTEICTVIEKAGVKDFPSAIPEYPAVVVERATVNDFSASVTQAFATLVVERASAQDFTFAIGVVNILALERASIADFPSATQAFLTLFVDRAAGIDRVLAGGVINLTITEHASITDGDGIVGMQEFAANIIEMASIFHEFVGTPTYLLQVIDTLSASDTVDAIGEYLVRIVERADVRDIPNADGSTFSFSLTERVGAHDEPGAPIMTGIAVIETATVRDAGATVRDLWVPVDDSATDTWVPVNDNPYSPWVPVPV